MDHNMDSNMDPNMDSNMDPNSDSNRGRVKGVSKWALTRGKLSEHSRANTRVTVQ